MQKAYKVRIIVLKTLNQELLWGGRLPDIADTMTNACRRMKEGLTFTVGEDGRMPSNFCTLAWHSIFPDVTTLRFGGNFTSMKKEGINYCCCPDGVHPVIFKLERID